MGRLWSAVMAAAAVQGAWGQAPLLELYDAKDWTLEVTVDVREDPANPDVRNVTFTATFGVSDVYDPDGNLVHQGGTTVTGSFSATINR